MRCRVFVLAAMVALLGGCANLGYLMQSVGGHSGLMQAARPIDQVMASPATDNDLRARLRNAQAARRYASEVLGLPDNDSYTEYADVHRSFVVWNVFATPELSLRMKQSCFPVVGCLDYRGYYDEKAARAAAARLRDDGWDVQVGGVPAYSTLGWYRDPLVNTFIRYPSGEVARLIFHELTHQAVYAKNDTSFNESLATTVEQVGTERWLALPANASQREAYQLFAQRKQDFIDLLLETRRRLAQVYGEDGKQNGPAPTAPKPAGLSPEQIEACRAQKAAVLADLHVRYEELKRTRWNGYAGYDGWMAQPLNNAYFASIATYHQWVPAFKAMLARCTSCRDGSLAPFLAQARELAKLPAAERKRRLQAELDRK